MAKAPRVRADFLRKSRREEEDDISQMVLGRQIGEKVGMLVGYRIEGLQDCGWKGSWIARRPGIQWSMDGGQLAAIEGWCQAQVPVPVPWGPVAAVGFSATPGWSGLTNCVFCKS